MRSIRLPSLLILPLILFLAPESARAQAGTDVLYEREVFEYPRGARPDPFRSLLLEGDLGIRAEDLMLRGVVHHEDPSRSIAVLTVEGTDRRIQARVGERVGPLRVLAIYPDRVEIVIEELGVARRETLRIVRPEPGETSR
ncbi:MAG: hypothetical protein WD737_12635 [Gemmatimonadota bacterium]